MNRSKAGFCLLLAAYLLAGPGGCQPAGKYGPLPRKTPEDQPKETRKTETGLSSPFAWMEPTGAERKGMEAEVPLRFIHAETQPAQWAKLTKFWTEIQVPATPLGRSRHEIRIKVPLGLADPAKNIPSSNPPTLGKWQLGKRLFFDSRYLYPDSFLDKRSCAACHQPGIGFTQESYPAPDRLKTATLINCAFNTYQFWDGRVETLEEVVQRSLRDEEEPTPAETLRRTTEAERRHAWLGIAHRLRRRGDYRDQFRRVFGTLPTQDNVAKALATYLRTVLAGDSLYDRARQATAGRPPGEADYLKVLTKEDLQALHRSKATPAEVAGELAVGDQLFHGRARCARCHPGPDFTDHGFHNIGLQALEDHRLLDQSLGRFARLPIGLKEARFLGAYKTPTLRALPGRAPFFHDGRHSEKGDGLAEAVRFHTGRTAQTAHLDPLLRDLTISDRAVEALVLFLRALDGKVDAVVKEPLQQGE